MSGPLGPRRQIVGEEEVRPPGGELFELYEVLSCGHRQPGRYDEGTGLSTAEERCCGGCRDGLPKGLVGETRNFVSFVD